METNTNEKNNYGWDQYNLPEEIEFTIAAITAISKRLKMMDPYLLGGSDGGIAALDLAIKIYQANTLDYGLRNEISNIQNMIQELCIQIENSHK